MAGTSTLNMRIDSQVKREAESVLKELGLPTSTAVGLFLRQVAMTKSIPFPIAVLQAPQAMSALRLSDEQLSALIRVGLDEAASGMRGTSLASARSELL